MNGKKISPMMNGGNLSSAEIDFIKKNVLLYTDGILGLGDFSNIIPIEEDYKFKEYASRYGVDVSRAEFLNEKEFFIYLNYDFFKKIEFSYEKITGIISFYQPICYVLKSTNIGERIRNDCSIYYDECKLLDGISKKVEVDTLINLGLYSEKIKRLYKGLENLEGWKLYEQLQKKKDDKEFLDNLFLKSGIVPDIEIIPHDMKLSKKYIEEVLISFGNMDQYKDIKKPLENLKNQLIKGGNPDLGKDIEKLLELGNKFFLDSTSLDEENFTKEQKRFRKELLHKLEEVKDWT
ncbi:MAG: hypothetical protein J7J93_01145, partial [Candidatus Aenigmarchaeota archaeon]|nr:hypothetical protein [Candidatus Aenigmarchaeota archaeon]